MIFKPIEQDHPFLDNKAREDGLWQRTDLDRMYQPVDALWPIYWLTVRIVEGKGISIATAFKSSMKAWWVNCDPFEPLPFDLVPVLGDMILKSSEGRLP